ncbi:MAG: hypothetical protein ABIG32_02665 [Candidatus Uhrbacteria bacterium]|nr:hypothetical protein [Patescibacteria group bacterium]MBU1906794.1 hypothetical protein [Patescibacteria group bacterium]
MLGHKLTIWFPAILITVVILGVIVYLTTFRSLDQRKAVREAIQEQLIAEESALEPFTSPLYVSLVMHAEEDLQGGVSPKVLVPDYDGDEALMLHFTTVLREFAQMCAGHGVKINFGSDWTFSDGVANFDPMFYTDLEAMGHEIDAHAHESYVMYHEVRGKIVTAGGNPTAVASGATEGNIYDRMSYFDSYWPEFQYIWGVALAGHGSGEDLSGWVWRPDTDDWLVHDSEGRYIYIGHGEQMNSVELIEEAVAGRYENRINTYALFTNPREFLALKGTEGIPDEWTAKPEDADYWENRIEWWDEFLSDLELVDEIEFASLTEIAEIFEANESNLDFEFTADDHPRSELPMTVRRKNAGYP